MTLTEARKAKGWSQGRLATELGLKSKGHICDIERRGAKPSLKVAIGLYRLLDVRTAPVATLTKKEIELLEKTLPA